MELKLKNGRLETLVEAGAELSAKPNRLPGSVAARVYRAKRLLGDAHMPVREATEAIMQEHGATSVNGQWQLTADAPGYAEAVKQLQALMDDETTLNLDPIPWADIEGGRFPCYLAPDHYGALLEAGIIFLPGPALVQELDSADHDAEAQLRALAAG